MGMRLSTSGSRCATFGSKPAIGLSCSATTTIWNFCGRRGKSTPRNVFPTSLREGYSNHRAFCLQDSRTRWAMRNTSPVFLQYFKACSPPDATGCVRRHTNCCGNAHAVYRYSSTFPATIKPIIGYPRVYVGLVHPLNTWEVPAILRFGSWNECPSPKADVSALKYWHELHGVEVVGISHDVMETLILPSCPPLRARHIQGN